MKKALTIAALTLSTLACSGCKQTIDDAIHVAAFMPLSGSFASNGEYIQRGVSLAEESLKAEGINLKVRYEDVCLANQAVTALQSITTDKRISAIVANYCVLSLAASKDILERNNMPILHTSIVPGKYIDNSHHAFSSFPTADEESRVIADYAYSTLGAKKAAVLFLSTQWGEGFYSRFKEHFSKLGGEVVFSEQAVIGTSDFKPELARLKKARPDVIFIVHAGGELTSILKQTASLGIKTPILTTSESYDDSVIIAAGDAANGLKFFTPNLSASSDYAKSFHDSYRTKYTDQPRPLSEHAYASTLIYGRSAKKCGADRECLYTALREHLVKARGGEEWSPSQFKLVKITEGKFKETLKR